MQLCCVVRSRLIEVMLMWMDGGAGKSQVSHGFRARACSGAAIEHENVQDNILDAIHYIYSNTVH